MSGLNRRGPSGEGPMTGRRMGRCNPDNKRKKATKPFKIRIPNCKEIPQLAAGKVVDKDLEMASDVF